MNWALRQIGKRNAVLHAPAVATAHRILTAAQSLPKGPPATAARWVARDALLELESDAVHKRLGLD